MSAKLNIDNTNNTENILTSIQLTVAELRRPRMHWPARSEAARAIVAVLTLLAIGACLTGGVDFILSHTMDVILTHR